MNKSNNILRHHLLAAQVFILLAVQVVISCNNKWKKPAEVTFLSKINTAGDNNWFSISESGAVIEALSFQGKRKQGKENVLLEKKLENGLPVSMDELATESGISIDVPQGTYTSITVLIKMKSVNRSPSFFIQGYFNYPDPNDTINFRVEYFSEDYVEFTLKTIDGSGEVNLIEGIPARATLSYNSTAWFLALNPDLLNSAEYTIIDGKQTLLISPDSNTDIYTVIVTGLKTGNEVVIE